jgi:predicted aminopeptidase
LLAACAELSYYAQSAGGQLRLLAGARPIDSALTDLTLAPSLREKLALARSIREFAVSQLQLPNNGSYRQVVLLERPFLIWNVFATATDSIEPQTHCFPIAGCVPYRGYFNEAAARDYAAELQSAGFDTYVAGVPAYSTLGWFNDPLPSSLLRYPEHEIARVIFHELAHQVVYLPGDATFNESFASSVEDMGVRRWFNSRPNAAGLADYELARQRRHDFLRLVQAARYGLVDAYSANTLAQRRAAAAAVYVTLHRAYAEQKERWGGYAGYDGFMSRVNNAALISIATYTDWVPAFDALLLRNGDDPAQFYAAARALADLPAESRRQEMLRLCAAVNCVALAQ